MGKRYPFYYEVRFQLLAFDEENNLRIEKNRKKIGVQDPLDSRAEAFDVFYEYVSFAEEHNRVIKNARGNYYIQQPTEYSKYLKSNDSNEIDIDNLRKHFREEVSIYIIVTDEELAKEKLGVLYTEKSVQTEFEIHKISSYSYEEQFLIDNLQDVELRLYQLLNLKCSQLVEEVFHYGMDYAESDEVEEDGARRVILKTPHIWQSYDEYLAIYGKSDVSVVEDKFVDYSPSIDFADIISKGESNQVEFKPCLVYNFKTGRGGIGVIYIIAKSICAFLNSNGGVLFIGVNDNGGVQGLKHDYSLFEKENKKDKIILQVDDLLSEFFGISLKPLIDARIENIDHKDVLIIEVQKSHKPIFLLNRKTGEVVKEMFIRLNASTHQLIDPEEMVNYVLNKKWKMN